MMHCVVCVELIRGPLHSLLSATVVFPLVNITQSEQRNKAENHFCYTRYHGIAATNTLSDSDSFPRNDLIVNGNATV